MASDHGSSPSPHSGHGEFRAVRYILSSLLTPSTGRQPGGPFDDVLSVRR